MTKNQAVKSNWQKNFKYSSAGIYIVVPIFLGLTIGLILDNLFKKGPTFTLVFLFFGTIGSFYNLYRLYKDLKHDKQ